MEESQVAWSKDDAEMALVEGYRDHHHLMKEHYLHIRGCQKIEHHQQWSLYHHSTTEDFQQETFLSDSRLLHKKK